MIPQKSVKSIRNAKYTGILFDKLSCVSNFFKDNYLNKNYNNVVCVSQTNVIYLPRRF